MEYRTQQICDHLRQLVTVNDKLRQTEALVGIRAKRLYHL